MEVNFFEPDPAYHEARRKFVYKGSPDPSESEPRLLGIEYRDDLPPVKTIGLTRDRGLLVAPDAIDPSPERPGSGHQGKSCQYVHHVVVA